LGSSGAGSRLQGDPESKLFEPFDEVVLGPFGSEFVQVGGAKIAILDEGVFENVVSSDEDLVCNGKGCSLGSAASFETPVLVAKVAILLFGGADGSLNKSSSQVVVSFADGLG